MRTPTSHWSTEFATATILLGVAFLAMLPFLHHTGML